MAGSGNFGEALGKRLNAQATSYASRSIRRSSIAVTELRYETPQFELSTPPAPEDAFMVGLYLTHSPCYTYWEEGRAAPGSAILPGQTIIYDLKRRPTFHLNHSFHTVHYYFSRASLNALADEASAPPIEELRYRAAVANDDMVVRNLSEALLPYFANPREVSRLFMDHMMLSIGQHVATRYGGMRVTGHPIRGGLAPWQQARAQEMLAASPDDEVSLAEVAMECNLSARQFARAFRQSLGVTPHRWRLEHRIEMAKIHLAKPGTSLVEIASAYGFADQSHFSRVFAAYTGTSPAAWRRSALL